MSAAHVQLNERCGIAFEAVDGRRTPTRGVLLTLEGSTPGEAMNCAVIPEERVGAVIASLQLVAKQLRAA